MSCVPVSMTKPSVFPLSGPRDKSANQVIIGCLIQNFFPSGPVTVTWGKNGEGVTVTDFPPAQATGGLYTMSSKLTLPASECPENTSVKCSVQHTSNPTQEVEVPCEEPVVVLPPVCGQPRLSLLRPALEDLLLGSDASLTCTLSGLKSPEKASFTWEPSVGKNAVQTTGRDSCGCYSVSSVLPGCAEPWNRGDIFTCTATHPESSQTLTATISKATENTFRPQVHLLPPPSEELALNELVSLTCLVRGFSPEDVLVRWLHGGQELPSSEYLTWKPLKEPEQGPTTFAVTSVLRVTAASWKQGDNFSCMVGHETLPLAFTQKTIDRLSGKPTHVNVSVIMAEADGTCY
ncbi:Hypothetical predicted protein [Marmota monax]|uniref:Ig-like domain-containing protein n=1 Tax=Marmota monax TaxID=9995 RepID=A0A5E4CFB2_MARMO|nr:Hypothetical predicted protein [Marmota monax]